MYFSVIALVTHIVIMLRWEDAYEKYLKRQQIVHSVHKTKTQSNPNYVFVNYGVLTISNCLISYNTN